MELVHVLVDSDPICFCDRLIDVAPDYYDLSNFPQCEARRQLERLYMKREREKGDSKNKK